MEEENNSSLEEYANSFGYNIDDYLVSKFKSAISNDLYYLRSSCSGCLWVFWTDPTHSAEREGRLIGQNHQRSIIRKSKSLVGKWLSNNKDSEDRNNLVMKEKIAKLLQRLQFPSYALDVLVQFWAPVMTTTKGPCFLATSDQPFGISHYNEGLCAFRKFCLDYKLYVDTPKTQKELGPIGRAFMQKSVELVPNMQSCCSSKECCPYLDCAVQCNVDGSLALPVLEPSSLDCVGVIELLFTSDNIHSACYTYFAYEVCNQLKALSLKSSAQEPGEELSPKVSHSSTEKAIDFFHMDQTTRESLDTTKGLENGKEMVQLDSSFQQLLVASDEINNGNDVCAQKSNMATTDSGKEGAIMIPKRERTKAENSISYEVLKGHLGMKLRYAAEKLGVSRSTLKRMCRQNEIPRWPSNKRSKVNHSLSEQDDFTSSNPPHDQAMLDESTATIKATYRDDIIKFQLSFSSKIADLEEEVAKRLKLKIGTFQIKYVDEDGDWILIGCDADLKNCMYNSRSSGTTTIKMLMQLITN